ncbi:MAG TPA: CotH kinase family protein [Bacteroidia bacterium]|jgi:subtilisin-like proprotein convertase family protein
MKKNLLLLLFLSSLTCFSQTYSGTGGAISDDGLNNDYPLNVSALSPATLNSVNGLVGICMNITHTWDSDLAISLIAPDGTEIMLLAGVGGSDDDFTNTCFSQSVSTSIVSGTAPFTGTFKPMNTLGNANNGQNGNGNWTLRIIDTYPADAGNLVSWNITFGAGAPLPNVFTSSNLPIVLINTFSQTIVDEPKINAGMKIIYNGPGMINYVTDAPNAYNNNIGIEIRGAFSSTLPQKPYAIETRNNLMLENDTSILGMPAEHDWFLLATYNDKVYVRNTLANKLFDEMSHYATRSRHCEVLINGQYQGIYYLCESPKRDKNRINVSKMDSLDNTGIPLTGGYIIKNDYWDASNSWLLGYNPIDHPTFQVHLVYDYPKPDKITPQQKTYIQTFINSMESALYSPSFADTAIGYRAYLSTTSFIDYFIVNELSRNTDGFKKSWYMHKNRDDKGGKLKAGPVWDFDWAWTNIPGCSIFSAADGSGWAYKMNDCGPDVNSNGWFVRMMQDTSFQNEVKCRWLTLRTSILDTGYIFNYIDSTAQALDSAQERHEEKWGTLGVDVGTPEVGAQPTTFQGDVDLFKSWIGLRIAWLDANMPGNCYTLGVNEISAQENAIMLFPNPANDHVFVNAENAAITASSMLIISDVQGRELQSIKLSNIPSEAVNIDLRDYASGTYLCRFVSKGIDVAKPVRLVIQK